MLLGGLLLVSAACDSRSGLSKVRDSAAEQSLSSLDAISSSGGSDSADVGAIGGSGRGTGGQSGTGGITTPVKDSGADVSGTAGSGGGGTGSDAGGTDGAADKSMSSLDAISSSGGSTRADVGATGGAGGGPGGQSGAGGITTPVKDGGADVSATGGSGGGGAGGGAGGGTGGAAIGCSASFSTPAPPVTVEAHLSCTSPAWVLSPAVAAGAGSNGFVLLTYNAGSATGAYPAIFFDIGTTAAQVTTISPDAPSAFLTSSATGVPAVVEQATPAGGPSCTWLTRTAGGTAPAWTSSTFSNNTDAAGSSLWLADNAIGPDGAQYVLGVQLLGYDQPFLTMLATRRTGDSAFAITTDLPAESTQGVLNVDAAGVPHASYWKYGIGLFDWQPGQGQDVVILPSTSANPVLGHVRPSGLGLALSAYLNDGIHVLRRKAGGTFDDILVPGSAPPTPIRSYSYTCYLLGSDSVDCANKSETYDTVGLPHHLVEAADGTLWLVTVRSHIDRTIIFQGSHVLTNCECTTSSYTNDHSTVTLALQRIAPGATAPSDILWSVPLRYASSAFALSNGLDATMSGTRIFIAVGEPSPDEVHYVVVDTSKIP